MPIERHLAMAPEGDGGLCTNGIRDVLWWWRQWFDINDARGRKCCDKSRQHTDEHMPPVDVVFDVHNFVFAGYTVSLQILAKSQSRRVAYLPGLLLNSTLARS